MKINPFLHCQNSNHVSLAQKYSQNPINNADTKNHDSFEKSKLQNVSFKGLDDIEISPEMMDFISGLVQDVVANIVVDTVCNSIDSIMDEIELEGSLEAYIDVFGERKTKNIIKAYKCDNMQTFCDRYFRDTTENDQHVIDLCKENGIVTFTQFDNFIRTLNSNKRTKASFKYQNIQALQIYGLLGPKKTFLPRFGELLLYKFNEQYVSENPQYSEVARQAEFLDNIKIKDLDDFEAKFAHLKPYFDDFSSMADVSQAIDYVALTYDKKIEYLGEVLKSDPETTKLNPRDVYLSQAGIIDSLYDKHKGKSLGDLSSYVSLLATEGRIKTGTYKTFAPSFYDFSTPEAKIDFFKVLKQSGFSVKDANVLAQKPVVETFDPLESLFNSEFSIAQISKFLSDDTNQAKDTYLIFKDLINEVFKNPEDDTADLENLVKVLVDFRVKSSASFLDFYNKVMGTREKTLDKAKISEFCSLLSMPESKAIYDTSKKKNISPLAQLKQTRADMDAQIKQIEQYLLQDTTGYFIGKSAKEIYLEYKPQIDKNPTNTAEILDDIKRFSIESSREYQNKIQQFSRFAPYFENKTELLNFVSRAKFKFDDSKSDNDYIQAVNDLLASIPKNNTSQIKYFTKTDFLARSIDLLPEFMAGFPTVQARNEMIGAIADKKIGSLPSLYSFYEHYMSEDNKTDNLEKFIKNLPSKVSFAQARTVLNSMQASLKELNSPELITNDNINDFDIQYFIDNSIYVNEASVLNKLLAQVFKAKDDKSFISALPNAVTDYPKTYSKFRVAQEIVSRIDLSDESYQNLTRLFHINRPSLGLNDNTSDYIYAKAIKEVLPDELMQLINSSDWPRLDDNSIPNLGLHAKLRLIDRFILGNISSVEELNSDETKQKLNTLIKEIYTLEPSKIRGTDRTKRLVFQTQTSFGPIETVILNTGEIVTIVPQRA